MLFYWLEIIGTIAFALSGALAAIKHRMDLSGVIVVAFVVGNGGGTLRDIMLQAPVFWFSQTQFIWVSVIAAVLCFLAASGRQFKDRIQSLNDGLLFFDAIGLGVFAVAGTAKALSFNVSPTIAVIMGTLSAVGGGVIRDILCNDIPVIFRRQLYATPALLGGVLYVLAGPYLSHTVAIFTCSLAVVLIRCLALYRNWHLPIVK